MNSGKNIVEKGKKNIVEMVNDMINFRATTKNQ